MNSDSSVEMRDVRYAYDDGTPVLRGASMDVADGAVHALMGANGAGKTTLLRLVAGLRAPDAGSVDVAGDDPVVGFAPENPRAGFFAETVAEEVAFFPKNRGLDVERHVERALEAMDAADLRDRAPVTLSGGEQRAVSLASVLAGDPPVVALDEPSSGLHAPAQRRLGHLLADLDRTVLLSTHDADFAYEFADSVSVLVDGEVVRTGDPADVLSDADLLSRAGVRTPGLVELAADLSLSRVPSSLEEAAEVVADR
jgi:cobalt/nickel transport system ATP-binding protein